MSPHLLLALALSTLIGLSLGLLGAGGSMLAVPVLVYVARLDVRPAIGLSLAVVGATALVGGLAHARAGRVDLRAAAVFGVAGIAGAPLGAHAMRAVPPRVLMLLFAALMLTVGALMLRGRAVARPETARARPAAVLAAGFAVGFLTGFLGVGGGFLVVPALALLARLAIHRAVGTSLLVIALNAAAALAAHLRQGTLPLGLAAAFTAAAALGALVGVRTGGGPGSPAAAPRVRSARDRGGRLAARPEPRRGLSVPRERLRSARRRSRGRRGGASPAPPRGRPAPERPGTSAAPP